MAKDLHKPKADKTAQFRAEVALRIKQAREDAGLSQRELAMRSGITQQQISYVENGDRLLTSYNVVKLADALGISTDYLLTGKSGIQEYKKLQDWLASLTEDQKDDLIILLNKVLARFRKSK